MEKDFDSWNELKKDINNQEKSIFCNQREIWWSSLGLNVGSEEDGKNELYERPVLIIKVFNKEMIRIAPLTSRLREDKNHVIVKFDDDIGAVRLTQVRTISTKRLSRKMSRLDSSQFERVISILKENLI